MGIAHRLPEYLHIPGADYAASDGLMTRTATNSTSARSTSGGFTETLGGADGDEIHRYIGTVVDLGKVGTVGYIEATLAVTEANTNDARAFVGVSSGMATGAGVFDATTGYTSGDHFGWCKEVDSMFHRSLCVSTSTSNAGSTSTTAFASATEYVVRVDWRVGTVGITLKVTVNGTVLDTITDFSLTGVNAGFAGLVLKATSANAEAIRVEKFICGNKQAV